MWIDYDFYAVTPVLIRVMQSFFGSGRVVTLPDINPRKIKSKNFVYIQS